MTTHSPRGRVTPVLAAAALLLVATAAGAAPKAPPAASPPQATFAGGCFWCVEAAFEGLPGVISVTSGYTGGKSANPTYENYSKAGHVEVIRIDFDPAKTSYARLLDVFWRNIDPTVADRQFCDVGSQYRSAIFVHDAAQRKAAEASLAAVAKKLGLPVKTQIADAGRFYPAEEYHQDYAKKNPLRYRYYRHGCGRDARLEELWGKD